MRLQKLGRFDEAQTEAETALKLDPTEAMYHKNIAYVLIAKGDSSLANAALEEAIRIKPKDGELHFLHSHHHRPRAPYAGLMFLIRPP